MHFVVINEDDAVVVSVLKSATDLELEVVVVSELSVKVSELAVVDPEVLVVTVVCGIKA